MTTTYHKYPRAEVFLRVNARVSVVSDLRPRTLILINSGVPGYFYYLRVSQA